jgi:hypothetical protein
MLNTGTRVKIHRLGGGLGSLTVALGCKGRYWFLTGPNMALW